MGLRDRFNKALAPYVARAVVPAVTQELIKSIGSPVKAKAQAIHMDPMAMLYGGGGFLERPTSMSFKLLQDMARRTPVIAAIINTRINQVASFARQADINEHTQNKVMGFKVVHKHKTTRKMSKKEKEFAKGIEDFIANCGYTPRIQNGVKRDNFVAFLKKIVRDTLSYDQINIEKVPNRKGEPAEFYAVDASTIRIATPEDWEKGIAYVQVIQGSVRESFSHDEMVFGVRNPRSDNDARGYGFAETEQMVGIVTAMLNADAYNMKFFQNGISAQGILNILTKDGSIPPDVMEAFRAQFQSQLMGVQNAWRTPIMNADKVEWVNLKPSNRDMEYAAWMNYLVNISTAIFQISPDEINFESTRGGAESAGGLSEASPETRLKHSRDKGLIPLLSFIADLMTEHFVEPFDPNFCFQFVGLDAKDEAEVVKVRSQEVESYKSLDEVREEGGLPPYKYDPEKPGSIILNPQLISFLEQQMMTQGMGGGEGGDEGYGEEVEPGGAGGQGKGGGEPDEGDEEPEGVGEEED